MTLHERADAYNRAFAKWPASHLHIVEEQGRDVLYGTWLIGNDYRNRSRYYGSYPPGYLERVLALFPDVSGPAPLAGAMPLFPEPEPVELPGPPRWPILHVFSGSLEAGDYVRCDSHQPSEWQCSVYDLPTVAAWRVRLGIADPPYSKEDAKRYGTAMIDRRRATAALAQVTKPGGHLVWLDTCWPMHSKRDWLTVGRIFLQRSTNHRARVITIFERAA